MNRMSFEDFKVKADKTFQSTALEKVQGGGATSDCHGGYPKYDPYKTLKDINDAIWKRP